MRSGRQSPVWVGLCRVARTFCASMYGYMDCFGWVLGYHGTWASGDRNMGFLSVVHKPYICMLTGVTAPQLLR